MLKTASAIISDVQPCIKSLSPDGVGALRISSVVIFFPAKMHWGRQKRNEADNGAAACTYAHSFSKVELDRQCTIKPSRCSRLDGRVIMKPCSFLDCNHRSLLDGCDVPLVITCAVKVSSDR